MAENENFAQDSPIDPHPRAIIVGASSGIGEAIARKLAREGYMLALLARREEALKSIASEINEQAGETRARFYPHDVTHYDKVPALFQKILSDLRRIDTIVYVSGVQPRMGISEYDFEKNHEMVAVSVLGAMAWLGQAAVVFESMGAGQIVGISSVAADRGRVANPAYNSAKAGENTFFEGLRNRLSRHGVKVLTVKPGFVDTALMVDAPMKFGMISTEKAADDIWRAMRRGKQTIYTPWWWRYIMLAIIHTPSFIFRRLSI